MGETLFFVRFFCCLYAFLLSVCSLWGQDINFKHLNVEDGLSQVSVMSILSDDLGQMWFATRHGLNVYNGNEIRPLLMETNGGKQGFERARQLCSDFRRYIYFLSDEELVAYDKRLNTFRSLGKNVMAICCRDSVLWAARGGGEIFQYDVENEELAFYAGIHGVSSELIIRCLLQDGQGRIWVGTEKGLYAIDGNRTSDCMLQDMDVKHLYEDHEGILWVSTSSQGLFKIVKGQIVRNFKSDPSKPNALLSNDVRCVVRDTYGNLWIGTNLGVSKLDNSETVFKNYFPLYNDTRTLSHNSVISMCCDKQGTIWIGTYSGGVDYFNPLDQAYSYINVREKEKCRFAINNIYPFSEGRLLVSSSLGLYTYDCQSRKLEFVNTPEGAHFISFASDVRTGKIYCGTSASGIFVYDVARKQMTPERITVDNSCLPGNYISGLVLEGEDLYVSTNKGFMVYDVKHRTSSPLLSDLTISSSTPSLLSMDSQKRLWIGFLSALIIEYDIETKQYVVHDELLPKKDLEQATRVYRILEDARHRLWAITSGKGIYRLNEDTGCFDLYVDDSKEWALNHCFDFQEMPDGQLAILTNSGISFMDMDRRAVLTHLYRERFAAGSVMSEGCGFYVDSSFNLYVGTLDGIVRFNYYDISLMPALNRLNFSRLFVDSEEVLPNQSPAVIPEMLPYVSEVHLQSGYRSFDIEISNMDYLRLGNEHLEYKLEGFDDQWNNTVQNRIHYTNISPGKYLLKVRNVQGDGEAQEEITMRIQVHPPFYASVWAFVVYCCLLALVAFFGVRIRDTRRRLQLDLEYEQREKLRIENLNKERIKFYINLSHELLTPISLIMAQIETLVMDCKELSAPIRTRINRIYKNADLLHLLVKEILDFRKNEHQREALKISQYNIVSILEEILDSFKDKARVQKIKLEWIAESQDIGLFVDREEFQKIICNLLSNAFKFTPAGGRITVGCRRRQQSVYIEVSDTGVGIPPEEMDKIFDRFYQASGGQEGTGIGLSYVKDVMTQYGGKVSVRNNDTGGCTFTLEFKEGYGHIHMLEHPVDEVLQSQPVEMKEESGVENEENSEGKHRILIVEDNEEMLALLVGAFQSLYEVRQARSAEEALSVLQSFSPDLIVSDVMMGGMSGIELCSRLKRNYETCHIPVVLLTALDGEENYMNGLQSGADDYMTKPFKVQHLIMRCNTLINNRRMLQNKFASMADSTPQVFATNEVDSLFIHKAQEVVERNLDNMDFGTDEFAQEMAMSRAKLYAKIKGVTGMTVKEFVLNIKLKKAAEYLACREDLLIADIAYKLGFSSTRVFSQSFKELFGDTPANYRKSRLHSSK